MRKLWIAVMALAGLLLIPSDGNPRTDEGATTGMPPVAQALVREGDFAVRLVEALGLGSQKDEESAEAVLTSAEVAPETGWVSDYPVTPEVMGDLQRAVAAAADARRLPMERDQALKSLGRVSAELGLPVAVDTDASDTSSEATGPEEGYGGTEDSAWVDRYYQDYGAPVITYYPPPEDYYGRYAWVPYPFWYSGYFFTGFYCLHNFHRVVVFRHAKKFVTNHRIDRRTGRVFVIDPADRLRGKRSHAWAGSASGQPAGSAAALRGSGGGTMGAPFIRQGSAPGGIMAVNPARSGSAGGRIQTQAPSEGSGGTRDVRGRNERGNSTRRDEEEFGNRPSPLGGSFSRPALPERPLLMQPRSDAKKSFDRGRPLDRSHRGGSSRGGFSQESRGAGSGRGSSAACKVRC